MTWSDFVLIGFLSGVTFAILFELLIIKFIEWESKKERALLKRDVTKWLIDRESEFK